MSEGFTPGPWRMDHDGSNWMVVTDDYPEMVDVWGFNGMPAVEVVANARLIAAAPELLEALSAIVERIDYYASLKDEGKPNIEDWAYTYSSTDMIEARAAIAKARGTPC